MLTYSSVAIKVDIVHNTAVLVNLEVNIVIREGEIILYGNLFRRLIGIIRCTVCRCGCRRGKGCLLRGKAYCVTGFIILESKVNTVGIDTRNIKRIANPRACL